MSRAKLDNKRIILTSLYEQQTSRIQSVYMDNKCKYRIGMNQVPGGAMSLTMQMTNMIHFEIGDKSSSKKARSY